MIKAWRFVCVGTVLTAGLGCGSNEESGSLEEDARPFIEQYATVVHTNYAASVTEAEALQTAVDAFVAAPSAETLDAAREAWLAAREPYGQTEVYRFYDGPIDNPTDGPEGQINAWPLDEAYIDYVAGDDTAGIVNDAATFPELTTEVLAAQNEQGGEKNIATGYHAVEFLLWGQDLSADGPGARPPTDYLTDGAGTAANQDRRGEYLALAAELLVSDLQSMREAWAPDAENYGSSFKTLDATEALRRILTGMGSLAGAELSGERMTVAYDNRDQEDEHSCFSDNTHRDIFLNALAVQNVYLGRYGNEDGPGLDDVVRPRDAALDTRMQAELQASLDAIEAIPAPFDQAIADDADRALVLAAIRALQTEAETLVEVATLLGVQINLE